MKTKIILSTIIILVIVMACTTNKGTDDDIAPAISIPANCLLKGWTSIADGTGTTRKSTFEYDTKNRLVKSTNGNNTINTYEYDQNDFLQMRTTGTNASSIIVDKFTYQNGKIILIESTSTVGANVSKAKTTYEYDNSGSLIKINKTDFDNGNVVSTYKNNILIAQTSNDQAYEINSLGLITKSTVTVSGRFVSAGQWVKYTYDKNGQVIKTESVDKNGIIVNISENEYSNIKEVNLSKTNFETFKGFPILGNNLTKYLIKKLVINLKDNNTNTFYEHLSWSYDSHRVDKNGLLLGYKVAEKSFDGKIFINNITFDYSGCE